MSLLTMEVKEVRSKLREGLHILNWVIPSRSKHLANKINIKRNIKKKITITKNAHNSGAQLLRFLGGRLALSFQLLLGGNNTEILSTAFKTFVLK